MKTLLPFLIAIACFFSAAAQNSLYHGRQAAKSTGWQNAGWFDYIAVMATDSATGHYRTLYNDSTITQYDSSSAQYIAVHDHGAGFSFDAYSKVWDSAFVNIDYIPGFAVPKTLWYSMDSIFIAGRYDRKPYNNYTDTLFIDIARVVTGSPASFELSDGPSASWAACSSDSVLRYFGAVYDADNNRLSDSVNFDLNSMQRITIPLSAAFFADSLPDGSHNRALWIPGNGLRVFANLGVVAYVHYKSGHMYAPGTPADSVNTWQQTCYELNGPGSRPYQVARERNIGLVSTSVSRYAPYFKPYQGHQMLMPAPYSDSMETNDWPYIAFYLSIEHEGIVEHTAHTIDKAIAYPNPASGRLTVSVTTTQAVPVTVSLIDMLGQTVAVQRALPAAGQQTVYFSTDRLPAGVYRYLVHAGTDQAGGDITVSH